jgi:hypothetical protein
MEGGIATGEMLLTVCSVGSLRGPQEDLPFLTIPLGKNCKAPGREVPCTNLGHSEHWIRSNDAARYTLVISQRTDSSGM